VWTESRGMNGRALLAGLADTTAEAAIAIALERVLLQLDTTAPSQQGQPLATVVIGDRGAAYDTVTDDLWKLRDAGFDTFALAVCAEMVALTRRDDLGS